MPVQRQHASCVRLAEQGVLITGAAGRGKSTLALGLLSLGGRLVADDQVLLHSADDGRLIATRPAGLPPLIEARGLGLLHAPLARSAQVALVIDMDRDEDQRLPPPRQITIMGLTRPLLYRSDPISFAQSVALLMRHGRNTP